MDKGGFGYLVQRPEDPFKPLKTKNMDWITDQIAIGDALDAVNHAAEVDSILCLLSDCCGDRSDIDGYCVPLYDGPGNSREHVLAAIDFIAAQVENGLRVLVHCRAGRSRSVCIVAAYLMRHQGLSKRLAMSMISKKRQICLSDGIEEMFKHICTSKPSLLSCLISFRIRNILPKPGSGNR
jgi:atypical dual specificity phosphatase